MKDSLKAALKAASFKSSCEHCRLGLDRVGMLYWWDGRRQSPGRVFSQDDGFYCGATLDRIKPVKGSLSPTLHREGELNRLTLVISGFLE